MRPYPRITATCMICNVLPAPVVKIQSSISHLLVLPSVLLRLDGLSHTQLGEQKENEAPQDGQSTKVHQQEKG